MDGLLGATSGGVQCRSSCEYRSPEMLWPSGQPSPILSSYMQIYKLSQSSLAELARNSVIQSGFEMEIKRHWLGQEWYMPGAAGNDINKVSTVILFRVGEALVNCLL